MAHWVAVTDLQPFQGPLPLSSFLTLIQQFISPPLCWMVWLPAGYSSPLGQGSFFLFCPFTTIFFYFTSVYTSVLFLPFLYCYFSIYSFPPFPSVPFQYYLDTSSLYQETVSPLWISVLLNCSLFSSPSSLRYSPVLKSALLCSLVSQPCTW